MSDVKKEIIFADSMHIDKRNEDFAYLRKNLSKGVTKGLFSSADFSVTFTVPFGYYVVYCDTDMIGVNGTVIKGMTVAYNFSTSFVKVYESSSQYSIP